MPLLKSNNSKLRADFTILGDIILMTLNHLKEFFWCLYSKSFQSLRKEGLGEIIGKILT